MNMNTQRILYTLLIALALAFCGVGLADVLEPPLTEEEATSISALVARAKVVSVEKMPADAAAPKGSHLITVDILTKGVSARERIIILWHEDTVQMASPPALPVVGATYKVYLREHFGGGRAQFDPVNPEWGFVAPPAEQESGPQFIQHTVKQGDTLYDLAKHYYGSGQRWDVLKVANFAQDAPEGVYPLKIGMKLNVPTFAMKKGKKPQAAGTQPSQQAKSSSNPAGPARAQVTVAGIISSLEGRRTWGSNAVKIWLKNPTVVVAAEVNNRKHFLHAWPANENDDHVPMLRVDGGDSLYQLTAAEFELLLSKNGKRTSTAPAQTQGSRSPKETIQALGTESRPATGPRDDLTLEMFLPYLTKRHNLNDVMRAFPHPHFYNAGGMFDWATYKLSDGTSLVVGEHYKGSATLYDSKHRIIKQFPFGSRVGTSTQPTHR